MVTQELLNSIFYYNDGKIFNLKSRGVAKKDSRSGSKCYNRPYRSVGVNGCRMLEHRVIFMMIMGYLPSIIDHISDSINDEGIKSNMISNLRECTKGQNHQKKISVKNKTSKYLGVYLNRNTGKWVSQISFNKKKITLGTFAHQIDAAIEYDKKALEFYGIHAGLNFKH